MMPPHRPKTQAEELEPRLLQSMVPPGKIMEEFFDNLAVKYRSVCIFIRNTTVYSVVQNILVLLQVISHFSGTICEFELL